MPKIVDHDKYRDDILLGCFNLFAARGFSGVTMREVAKELDISTGSLYHYFPNKQEMFEGIFKRLACTSKIPRILCGDFNTPQI